MLTNLAKYWWLKDQAGDLISILRFLFSSNQLL